MASQDVLSNHASRIHDYASRIEAWARVLHDMRARRPAPTIPDVASVLPQQTAIIPAAAVVTAGSGTNTTVTVEENYWPNIVRWLCTGVGPTPVVHCKICCASKLSITGLQECGTDNSNSDSEFEDPYVLPCGHVLGAACMELWARECIVSLNGTDPTCPVCREPLYTDGAQLAMLRGRVTPGRVTEGMPEVQWLHAELFALLNGLQAVDGRPSLPDDSESEDEALQDDSESQEEALQDNSELEEED